ncbi:hypothetical protein N665_0094s0038 [Sinapis alba]|nr:hypothetical protein N665_0094s0038 [Sinapis alba]
MEAIGFSETEMEAAEQLMQLSEDDTLSCSSGCEGGVITKRHDDVVTCDQFHEEQNDSVVVRMMMNKNATEGQSFVKTTKIIRRYYKKKKFRSLASLYRATKEI